MKKLNLSEKNYIIPLFLVLITLISRIFVAEKYFFGYDSINYALGVIDFSLKATRPHLPGSFLFVKSIEAINVIVGNIHQSFLILLNIFSVLSVWLTYFVFLKIFTPQKAIYLIVFLIFNPMVWFYGSVTEIYVFDWFFASLILFISFQKRAIYILPIVFGIFSGFRPSSAALLLPLYFYLLWNEKLINWSKLFVFVSLALVFCLSWFLPLINSVGGIKEYFLLFSTNNPMESISFAQNIFRLSSIMFYFIVPFSFLLFAKRGNQLIDIAEIIKIMFLIIPSVLFFVFSHYSKGYALIIISPIVIFVGILLRENYRLPLTIAILAEIGIFLFLPTNETSLESKINPKVRKSGITQIWFDRTFSDYSLTFSEISLRDKSLNNLIDLIKSTKSDRIFLDPTISHFGRPLQFYFPQIEILSVDFKKSKRYIQFRNKEVNQIFIENYSKNDVLIVRKDFYDNYLSNFKPEITEDNLIVLSKTDNLHSAFESIVDSLFVRN